MNRKLRVTEMNRLSVDDFRLSDKMFLTVVLDNVRSMHNVGSVLRTSDAFRVERVVMCGITSTPPHPELHKTALGAEDSVAWEYRDDCSSFVDELHADGYTVMAIEQCEGSIMLHNLDLSTLQCRKPLAMSKTCQKRFAIVLGNEVHGVQQEVIDKCDGCIEIQQFGTKHSMNVSVTAGIVIWEFARRLLLLISIFLLTSLSISAQSDIVDDSPVNLDDLAKIMPEWKMMRDPELYEGEWIIHIVLPEISVYKPLKFKNEKQKRQFSRLVMNVKKVLPIAKMANGMIRETYEVMQHLPDKKSRDAHMKAVEKEVKRIYTPRMKQLTFSQGKLLIKLIDRECNQTSYEIVKAFLGPTRAMFYQVFAWTFGASLKKTYNPEDDDMMVERVVRQIESGAI